MQTGAQIKFDSVAEYYGTSLAGPIIYPNALSLEERVWENAFIGAISLGYRGCLTDRWLLAGELYVSISKSRATLDPRAASDLSEIVQPSIFTPNWALEQSAVAQLNNWEFGVDILPGVQIDNCNLLYGRIGIAFNKQKLDASSIYRVSVPPPVIAFDVNSPIALNDESSQVALRLGFGLEHSICPRLAITGDYIFTFYGDASSTVTDIYYPVNILDFDEYKHIAQVSSYYRTQSLTLGLRYYFS